MEVEKLNLSEIKGWEPRLGVGPEKFVKILVEDKMDTEKLENLAKFYTPTRFKDRKFCPDFYTMIISETRSIF